jgi:hypothetical protein
MTRPQRRGCRGSTPRSQAFSLQIAFIRPIWISHGSRFTHRPPHCRFGAHWPCSAATLRRGRVGHGARPRWIVRPHDWPQRGGCVVSNDSDLGGCVLCDLDRPDTYCEGIARAGASGPNSAARRRATASGIARLGAFGPDARAGRFRHSARSVRSPTTCSRRSTGSRARSDRPRANRFAAKRSRACRPNAGAAAGPLTKP